MMAKEDGEKNDVGVGEGDVGERDAEEGEGGE